MGVAKMEGKRRNKAMIFRLGLVALVLIAVALAFSFTQERATGASAAAPQSVQQLTRLGTTTIHATAIGNGAVADPEIDNRPELGDEAGIKLGGSSAAAIIHPFAAPQSRGPAHRANFRIPSKEAARRGFTANNAARENSSTFPPPEPNVPAPLTVVMARGRKLSVRVRFPRRAVSCEPGSCAARRPSSCCARLHRSGKTDS